MARIDKAEHSKILRAVDVEGRKVSEVALEQGCTPAAIYALLGKLRRAAPAVPVAAPAVDLFAAAVASAPVGIAAAARVAPSAMVPVADTAAAPARRAAKAAVERAALGPVAPAAVAPVGPSAAVPVARAAPAPVASKPVPPPKPAPSATVTALPARKQGGLGAALAKPGFGLVMRTDGEESLTPFRSLDDLLSAVKPILRAAARSPDAVWFSIQLVDLASLDSDAA